MQAMEAEQVVDERITDEDTEVIFLLCCSRMSLAIL